jgi:hypothetical protein
MAWTIPKVPHGYVPPLKYSTSAALYGFTGAKAAYAKSIFHGAVASLIPLRFGKRYGFQLIAGGG